MSAAAESAYRPAASLRAGGAVLRSLERALPALATPLALRLFFTPLPGKWVARRRPVPAPWQARHWPFEGASLTLWRRGDVPAGAPRVLLVHGWAGDAQQLRPLGDALAARGVDAVLLDFPGHGRSRGWRTSLPQWVRAVFAVSGALGPWQGAAGHSAGAMALAHAAARGLPVQRLALVATAPPPRAILRVFGQALALPEGLQQRMRERIEAVEGIPLAQFETDWLGPRVTAPTLLVHDRDDRIAPLRQGQGLAAALPAAQILVTEGLGHRRLLADGNVLQQLAGHLATGH